MAYTFHLPDIGEGLEEAEIIVWLVAPGDKVDRDQPLVEVLTDKANSELPSPVAGTVLRLGAAEGERLQVGDVLIELDDGSQGDADVPEESPSPAEASTAALELSNSGEAGLVSRVKAAPATRKLARELEVELADVDGTGPGGRITADDVRAATSDATGAGSSEPPATTKKSPTATETLELGQMDAGRHPLRGIRGVVARNMAQSWSDIPHIHSIDEVDATLLMDLRVRIRSMDRPGASAVTPLTIAAAATARALCRYPMVNGCVEGDPMDTIVIHSSVNLGIATATPGGLVVPVVHDADRLDLFALATAIAELASTARTGKLTASDLSGATFTITNYGALGGRWALPIIPPGQAGILGIGAISERPVVIDGQVEARSTLPIVLGADHRLVDGDLAEAFKRSVMDDLVEPLNLLVGD
ncbi:MAG: dihydrolipoamide acetyltransferase family protein [Actinomycetota bacterium]|nr:dihydrolipoamide acetyltransferase family protein [Actinomycetota bacterium]